MEKRVVFNHKILPYLLLAPQLLITVIFFFLPAGQAIWQSFFIESAFGGDRQFVGLDNYTALFDNPYYFDSFKVTFVFSIAVAVTGLSVSLLLAIMADRVIKGAMLYKTMLIWPYAVAPAVVGVLWAFLFSPAVGTLAVYLTQMGLDWNPRLDSTDAMILVVMAAVWKQISYNFLFFLAGLQSIPKSLIEAAAIDGASPARRFWTIIFPLLSPTTFFYWSLTWFTHFLKPSPLLTPPHKAAPAAQPTFWSTTSTKRLSNHLITALPARNPSFLCLLSFC